MKSRGLFCLGCSLLLLMTGCGTTSRIYSNQFSDVKRAVQGYENDERFKPITIPPITKVTEDAPDRYQVKVYDTHLWGGIFTRRTTLTVINTPTNQTRLDVVTRRGGLLRCIRDHDRESAIVQKISNKLHQP